jgi:hypothetical protein
MLIVISDCRSIRYESMTQCDRKINPIPHDFNNETKIATIFSSQDQVLCRGI